MEVNINTGSYDNGEISNVNDDYIKSYCPFGQVGDRLWVRETFALGLATKSGYAWRAGFDAEKGVVSIEKLCLPSADAWKEFPENVPTQTITVPLSKN